MGWRCSFLRDHELHPKIFVIPNSLSSTLTAGSLSLAEPLLRSAWRMPGPLFGIWALSSRRIRLTRLHSRICKPSFVPKCGTSGTWARWRQRRPGLVKSLAQERSRPFKSWLFKMGIQSFRMLSATAFLRELLSSWRSRRFLRSSRRCFHLHHNVQLLLQERLHRALEVCVTSASMVGNFLWIHTVCWTWWPWRMKISKSGGPSVESMQPNNGSQRIVLKFSIFDWLPGFVFVWNNLDSVGRSKDAYFQCFLRHYLIAVVKTFTVVIVVLISLFRYTRNQELFRLRVWLFRGSASGLGRSAWRQSAQLLWSPRIWTSGLETPPILLARWVPLSCLDTTQVLMRRSLSLATRLSECQISPKLGDSRASTIKVFWHESYWY